MRVLAIDGGGVRGVVPCGALALWEAELGLTACDSFELFVGTSTGAIVAAAFAMGLSAERILNTFQTQALEIFSREGLGMPERLLSFKGWAKPAYKGEVIKSILEHEFGAATMGDCPRALSIPCLDVVTGSPRIFRSRHHPEGSSDCDVTIADAVLASTAAPTFFPSAAVAGSTYVDGALWANNPALLALLDARDLVGESAEEISLLSLGCGRPFWGRNVGYGGNRGVLGWGAPLIALMMAAQSEGVDDYVRRLMPKGTYLRVDPKIPKELSSLDNTGNMGRLLVHAGEEARSKRDEVRDFLAG